jgi:predicted DNA-binding protein
VTKKPKEQKQLRTTKQLGVQVDVGLWKRFRKLAVDRDRTAGDLLKEAMEEFLQRHEDGGR